MKLLNFICLVFVLGIFFINMPIAYAAYDISEMRTIEKMFRSNVKPDGVIYFTYVPRGLIVSIDENVFFNKSQEKLKKSGLCVLNEIGAVLSKTNKSCVIEGHTESANPEISSFRENWELSLARAHSITMYLMRYLKISPERLYCIGYGEFMPYVDSVSQEGNMNNRIDFVIIDYSAER